MHDSPLILLVLIGINEKNTGVKIVPSDLKLSILNVITTLIEEEA